MFVTFYIEYALKPGVVLFVILHHTFTLSFETCMALSVTMLLSHCSVWGIYLILFQFPGTLIIIWPRPLSWQDGSIFLVPKCSGQSCWLKKKVLSICLDQVLNPTGCCICMTCIASKCENMRYVQYIRSAQYILSIKRKNSVTFHPFIA